jgi:hypothetical protein
MPSSSDPGQGCGVPRAVGVEVFAGAGALDGGPAAVDPSPVPLQPVSRTTDSVVVMSMLARTMVFPVELIRTA